MIFARRRTARTSPRTSPRTSRTATDWKSSLRKALRRVAPVAGMRRQLIYANAGMQRALNTFQGPLTAAVVRELNWREVMGRMRRQPRDPRDALRLYLAQVNRLVDGASSQRQLAFGAARRLT